MDVRTQRITGLERVWAERVQSTHARHPDSVAATTETRVDISDRADLLAQLSTLRNNDPEKFKELLGSLSANLTAAANPESGQVGSELGRLAKQLEQVARSGDPSRLQQPTSVPTSSHRAVAAYLRNAPASSQAPLTQTAREALGYVMSAISEANRALAPADEPAPR